MGVGGRTIAEAKRNLTINEFNVWIAYMTKKGMLVPEAKQTSKTDTQLSGQAKLLLTLNPNTVIE